MPLSLSASPMTVAQLRVLAYLPTHLTYTEIAVQLFISRHTVKTHAIAIFRKLGVSSRSQAIVVASGLGFFDGLPNRTLAAKRFARPSQHNPWSSPPLHLVASSKSTVKTAPHGDFVFLTTKEQSILSELLASTRTDESTHVDGTARTRSAAGEAADIDALAKKLDGIGAGRTVSVPRVPDRGSTSLSRAAT